MMISNGKAARFLFGGAGLLLVFSACSDDSAPEAGSAAGNTATSVAGASPSVSVDPGVTTTTVAGAPAPTLAPVDGVALLQQAVAATGAGYHFNQTATLDGVVALTIDGDRLPDGARLVVGNDAGLVYYVITSEGTWLMPDNGEWELDDSDPPTVDPIAALNTPSSVTVARNDGTTVQLAVSVPISSLGIDGDGDVPLQVSVVGGSLNTITYSTTTPEGRAAATTTVIGPVVDPSPVVAPI